MNSVFDKFFYAKSICVVGASSKPKSLGYELTKSILGYGYTGDLILVNPKSEEILGVKCFPSIKEVDKEIDLAILMVPKQFVEDSLNDLLAKNVQAIILITAGFKETGEAGELAEKRIIELIKNSNARLVGPNCMGIINTHEQIKMNATFVAEQPRQGNLAFCSQSGAIGAAVLNSLRETDIRFGQFISVGNKADVNELDLLDYWNSNEDIKIICFYLESFVSGENFIKYFIDNKVSKPVIVLKSGRTESGIKAASSHTGAIASSDKVVDAVLKQFGIIRSDDLNDMFNTAKGFEEFPIPKGNRVAVVTNAGGPAILTVDSLEKNNLVLAELSESTKQQLRQIVHPEGSVKNPVDLLPGGTAEQFKSVVEILLTDDKVDSVISIFVEPIMVKALPVIEGINEIETEKPVFQIVMPLPEFWEEYRQHSKTRKPLFRFAEDVSVVVRNMLFYNNSDSSSDRLKENIGLNKMDLSKFKGQFIPQDLVNSLAYQYSLPLVEQKIISFDEVEEAEIKYPIVLKAIGNEIVHKSELDAVILDIKNFEQFKDSVQKMKDNLSSKGIELEQVLIQNYLQTKFELLVGAFRDNNFGPMIMFGTGGKYVEYIDDTAMCSAYLNEKDIEDLINSTKIGKIIRGVRGEKSIDIDKLKNVIKSLAQMMLDYDEITEVDLNPLIVTHQNELRAVDIRIKC
jgi:acetyltransferase